MAEKNIVEKYKVFPENLKYEASNLGNVRNTITKRVLKPGIGTHGYRTVVLSARINANGKEFSVSKSMRISRIIYKTWIGSIPEAHVIDNRDGDRTNDRIDNLEAVTQKENIRRGLIRRGIKLKSNPRWNITYTAEYAAVKKEKMQYLFNSEANPEFKGWYKCLGVRYSSSITAGKAFGVHSVTIRRRCKKNKNGFYFIPVTEAERTKAVSDITEKVRKMFTSTNTASQKIDVNYTYKSQEAAK